jgi:hypothetical protein
MEDSRREAFGSASRMHGLGSAEVDSQAQAPVQRSTPSFLFLTLNPSVSDNSSIDALAFRLPRRIYASQVYRDSGS